MRIVSTRSLKFPEDYERKYILTTSDVSPDIKTANFILAFNGSPFPLSFSFSEDNNRLTGKIEGGDNKAINFPVELYEYRRYPSKVIAFTAIANILSKFEDLEDEIFSNSEKGLYIYNSIVFAINRILDENLFYSSIEEFADNYDLINDDNEYLLYSPTPEEIKEILLEE